MWVSVTSTKAPTSVSMFRALPTLSGWGAFLGRSPVVNDVVSLDDDANYAFPGAPRNLGRRAALRECRTGTGRRRPNPHISRQQVATIWRNSVRSARMTVSRQARLTCTHQREYRHHAARRGGFHDSGPWSPFERFDDALTAMSSELSRSFAKRRRRSRDQRCAPDRQAFATGTTWSMSTRLLSVKVRPS